MHELMGKPIEQFRMAWCFAACSEIVRCGNDAAAKVMQPNPIDENAGGQRIIGRGYPSGEIKSCGWTRSGRWALAGYHGGGLQSREDGWRTRSDLHARTHEVAPNHHVCFAARAFFEGLGMGDDRLLALPVFQLIVQFGQFLVL